MQVILLERVEKLGQMGDEVKVKDGFARNFLLPKKKALRATKSNREYFVTQKAQLEARNLERRSEAEKVSKTLEGKIFTLLRQAGDRGQLYGSVSPRDIAEAISAGGVSVDRAQVPLSQAIKTIGLFPMSVVLHPEVKVGVTINVARTEDEAERQARGEDVLSEQTPEEEAAVNAEALFEEGAGPKEEDAGEDAEA
jgi:large subunit ribosomal protein L9